MSSWEPPNILPPKSLISEITTLTPSRASLISLATLLGSVGPNTTWALYGVLCRKLDESIALALGPAIL